MPYYSPVFSDGSTPNDLGDRVIVGQGRGTAYVDESDASGGDLVDDASSGSGRHAVYVPHAVLSMMAKQAKERNRRGNASSSSPTTTAVTAPSISSSSASTSPLQVKDPELERIRKELEETKRERELAEAKLALEKERRNLEKTDAALQQATDEREAEIEFAKTEVRKLIYNYSFIYFLRVAFGIAWDSAHVAGVGIYP